MMTEIHQKLLEQALKSGRALQSKETRFVHHYQGKSDQTIHQTIPFYENLLFALALARTRTVEGVQEAKALLEKLLAYQSPNGLFPVYLHEFPFYHDQYIGAHLLPVFYWLDHLFHSVIGIDLKGPIQKLISATVPEVAHMPAALQAKALGALIAFKKAPEISFPLLDQCEGSKEKADWITGRLLAKLPLPEIKDWDPFMQLYTGDWRAIRFERGSPEVTLYDLYACSIAGELPRRLPAHHPVWLQAALCLPTEPHLTLAPKPVSPFTVIHLPAAEEGYPSGSYPFVLAWGKEPRSLILHPGALKNVDARTETVDFTLGAKPPLEDREACREIVFSLQEFPGFRLLVNGSPATTFRVDDEVMIELQNVTISLRFECIGRGVFQGHLSRGTKPTEWLNAGVNRYNGYDWLISLRTVDRDENTKIRMHYSFVDRPLPADRLP
jgi:hypothetical protein